MTADEAMERLNVVLAHAWMVRSFLKHAEEIEDNEEMLEVHRLIYDSIRAVEPSYQRRDSGEYVRRLRGKLAKLRKVADYFAAEYRNVSSHTNFEMAARSLSGCVRHIEEILAAVKETTEAAPRSEEA
jgi:hypothetical protein